MTTFATQAPRFKALAASVIFIFSLVLTTSLTKSLVSAQTQQQSGSVGVEGTIPTAPPTQAAFISIPKNGQVFTTLPINVSGLCTKGLLVEVFKNGVFAGSAQCTTGSFSIQIDLFEGRNDLVARQYDALDQASPDSNTVTVTFNSGLPGGGTRVSITTAYAKRGAEPGTTLTWPLTISGGSGPFAISVDWGDKSVPDLISRATPGEFTIEHTYSQAGIYNITIKVTDINGSTAFLQVVGIGNGPIQQSVAKVGGGAAKTERVVVWWPFLVTFVLIAVAFWVGKQHELELIRDRLRRGERPFK